MATEDFTTWTEADPSGYLTVASSSVSWDDLRRDDVSAHLYKDLQNPNGTTSLSGHFTHRFKYTVPAEAEADVSCWVYPWYIANSVAQWPFYLENAGGGVEDYQGLYFVNSAGNPVLVLRIVENGVAVVSDVSVALSFGTIYYITINRDDSGGVNDSGRLTCYINTGNYQGLGGTTLVDTLTADASSSEDIDYRYIVTASARGNDVPSAESCDGIVENLDLTPTTALRDYYNINEDTFRSCFGSSVFIGQVFTASEDYTLSSVRIKLYRSGSPGELTIQLQSVAGSVPSDTVLDSATYDGDTLPTSSGSAEWVELVLDYTLESGTKYAIVVKALDGDAGNQVRWRADGSGPLYSPGTYVFTTTGPGNWNTGGYDMMFETYGVLGVAPTIDDQSSSQTVDFNSNLTLSVTASGTEPISYQWKEDEDNLVGETSSTLELTSITTEHTYTCTVSNDFGSATTSDIVITVRPGITSQPSSATVTEGGNTSFSITAGGSTPLIYQWYKGGVEISGETSTTLSLTFVESSDAGSYFCRVTNAYGTVDSNTVTLTVGENLFSWKLFGLYIDQGRI